MKKEKNGLLYDYFELACKLYDEKNDDVDL